STSVHQGRHDAWRHHASRDGVLAAGVASSDADVVDVATGGVDGDVCGPAPLRCATRTRHARTFHATPKDRDDTPTVSDETDHETTHEQHNETPRRKGHHDAARSADVTHHTAHNTHRPRRHPTRPHMQGEPPQV